MRKEMRKDWSKESKNKLDTFFDAFSQYRAPLFITIYTNKNIKEIKREWDLS